VRGRLGATRGPSLRSRPPSPAQPLARLAHLSPAAQGRGLGKRMPGLSKHGVYGHPPQGLAAVPARAVQLSPLVPGAAALEDAPAGSFARLTIAAPPGTLERRFVLAHALRALAPDGELIALAPKDKGGARL